MIDAIEKIEEAQKRYWNSDKGKETQSKYHSSKKGREATTRYLNSEKGRMALLRYYLSEKGKMARQRQNNLRKLLTQCDSFLKENPDRTITDFLSTLGDKNQKRSYTYGND